MLLAACAHHAAVEVPAACAAKGGANACIGWAMDLVYLGAADRRYDDPDLEAYVESVADRVGRAAGLAHVRVRLLDDDGAEASALGGDLVYVNRGVLARLSDEAELAALLGHEVTHLVAQHTADLLHSDEDSAMSDDERLRRRDDDEALADERAVAWVEAAGYDPRAVLSMMRAIERGDDGHDPPAGEGLDRAAPEDDHPPVAIRLARIARLLRLAPGGSLRMNGDRRYRDRFLAHVEGLVVGDDPRHGRVAGTAWVRAGSRLAIDLPRGWKASGSAELELATPDGATVNVSTVGRAWADVLRGVMVDVHATHLAGRAATLGRVMPSASDTADADDPKVTIHADAIGTPVALIDDGERTIQIGAGGTHAIAQLGTLLARVRRATDAEVAAATPRRLHVRAAPRAGTVAAVAPLVCADPAAARALDDPARVVAPGDPIKCVE